MEDGGGDRLRNEFAVSQLQFTFKKKDEDRVTYERVIRKLNG